MGLDATVMCTCYRDGRATPPPFPDLIVMNEEGYIDLNVPYEGHEEQHRRFWEWQQHGCIHEEMKYVSEHISNWSGYRAFQQALEQVGWKYFPTLRAELPDANGGLMSPESAAKALQELEYFQHQAVLGTNVFLVDSETGDELYAYIAGYGGKFILSGRDDVDIGLDEHGLFIVTRAEPVRELFRSMRFEQHLLDPVETEEHRNGQVEYVDVATGTRFVCRTAVSGHTIPWPDGRYQNDQGQVRFSYPRALHVMQRKLVPADFEYILKALTTVFLAAITTGNPVVWC